MLLLVKILLAFMCLKMSLFYLYFSAIFASYRILNFLCFPFSALKALFHGLLPCIISDERSVVILILILPLYITHPNSGAPALVRVPWLHHLMMDGIVARMCVKERSHCQAGSQRVLRDPEQLPTRSHLLEVHHLPMLLH